MKSTTIAIVLAAGILAAVSGPGLAAGFEVAEQSGKLLGSAMAGRAVEANDASTSFLNPAGMTRIMTLQGALSLHALHAQGDGTDGGSTGVFGTIDGDDGGDPGGITLIPNLHLVAPVCEDLAVGFSVTPPFGLTTEYADGWKGRYHALESRLSTTNLGASVGWRFAPGISIGAGVDCQYADATLSNAIDFGTIGHATLGSTAATSLGLVPEGNDGEVVVEGDSWSWGFDIGLLFEVTESTRFGIAYRSKISHTLEGDANFTVPTEAAVLTSTGRFTDCDATARVTLPEQVSIGFYHDISERWAIVADATWTNWSRFRELRVKFDSPQPDAATPEHWNAVWRLSAGAIYRPACRWTLRAGVAWDESPIPESYRTPRIPTNDRFWITLGAGYRASDSITVDVSYLHVFIKDGDVDQTASTGQRLVTTMESSANVLAAQVTIGF